MNAQQDMACVFVCSRTIITKIVMSQFLLFSLSRGGMVHKIHGSVHTTVLWLRFSVQFGIR